MKLTKKTYLTTESDKLIDRNFNELGKTTSRINIPSFFQIYKDIFFRIPKTGTNSHTTLYHESGQYLENPQSSSSNKIKRLNKQLKELQLKISELEHKNEMLSSTNVAQELKIRETNKVK